jgi:alpha/beta superfamily hydrolase
MMLPVEEAVRRYRVPVLIVHGDADETVPVSCAVRLAGQYENATLAVIEGDTHCYDNSLWKVEKTVADFLEGQI